MGNIFKKDFIGYFFISIIVIIVLAHFASKYFHIGKFDGIINYLLLVAGIWALIFGLKAIFTKKVYIYPNRGLGLGRLLFYRFIGYGNMTGKKAKRTGFFYILLGVLLVMLFFYLQGI